MFDDDDEYADFWRKLQRRFDLQHKQGGQRRGPPRLVEELGPALEKPDRVYTRTCIGPDGCTKRFKTTSPYKRLCENCSKVVRDAPFLSSW